MNTTCLNSIYCCICIYIYKCRCTKDLAILIAICSIQHEEDCRRHHFTFLVETAFLTIRNGYTLYSGVWSPPGRSLLYWTRLLNNDMVGHSWRSTSRQDRVLNLENFLYHIILINSTLTSFRWNPNFRPRVMQSLFIRWHTPVTLSALVLYMVAAYVCGTAVYMRCTGSMIPLLLGATG